MKKIIVTGGLGFIGSNLIDILIKKKFFVINLDKITYSSNFYNTKNFKNLKNYKFIKDSFESEEYKMRHEKVRQLDQLSNDLNIPLVNLALGWCLKNDNVSTVILGASKAEQLNQNLKTLDYMDLINDDAMEKIEKILQN